MAGSKKTSGNKTEAKQKLIILALNPKPVGLTTKELKALEKALKKAGEASVESYESLETVVVTVPEMMTDRR